jgi:hypothetical protein
MDKKMHQNNFRHFQLKKKRKEKEKLISLRQLILRLSTYDTITFFLPNL